MTAPRTPPDDDPEADLSDIERAEIERAAEITPEDLARAAARWRQDASPALRDLLDATPDDDA